MNSTINTPLLANQFDPNFRAISFALLISVVMHLSIMRALPWLEAVKTKLPLNIIAELQTLAPPPAESKSIEPPIKPEVVKSTPQPKPTPQVVATPVLAAQHTEHISNYIVPDIPQPATMPTQPSPVVAPEVQTKEAAVTTTSSAPSRAVTSTTSTSAWENSDVWDEYGSDLQRLCERYKQYPAIAIRRGYQGSGKILVRFSAEGKTISVTMAISTGQKSLDDQALEMVRKSLKELPVPAKFKGREFKLIIPVGFKLE